MRESYREQLAHWQSLLELWVISKTKKTKNQQRNDDFKQWIQETKPVLDNMTKAKIKEQLILRERHLWQSGFDDWWKEQDIHKGKPGRKPLFYASQKIRGLKSGD